MKYFLRIFMGGFSLFLASWLGLTLFLFFYAPSQKQVFPDMVVVLGAGYHKDGQPVPALEARLKTAAYLWRHTAPQPVLMISGRKEEVWVMHQYLVQEGIPSAKITPDVGGTNTAATVRRLRRFSDKKLVFVSQAYHLPRISLYTKAYGLKNAECIAAERVKVAFWEKLPMAARESTAIFLFPLQRLFVKDYR